MGEHAAERGRPADVDVPAMTACVAAGLKPCGWTARARRGTPKQVGVSSSLVEASGYPVGDQARQRLRRAAHDSESPFWFFAGVFSARGPVGRLVGCHGK